MAQKKTFKKKYYAILFAIAIAAVLTLSLFSTLSAQIQSLNTTSIPPGELSPAVSTMKPIEKTAGPESQFDVKIAYAYVGPPAPDQVSYYSEKFNSTMILATDYPSTVYLNFTRRSSIQISPCDAVIQLYGIKIVSDTGGTEYHAYSVGANFTAFSSSQRLTLLQYSDNLLDSDKYYSPRGIFNFKWEDNTSLLSRMMGSAGSYTTPTKDTKAFNERSLSNNGVPNSISVTVYRLGYVTMTNGAVTIYKDMEATQNALSNVILNKYQDGFIFNTLVPTEQLPQIDLLHPI